MKDEEEEEEGASSHVSFLWTYCFDAFVMSSVFIGALRAAALGGNRRRGRRVEEKGGEEVILAIRGLR